MAQVVHKVPCPTPGCGGSRADVYEVDENGNIIARISSSGCQACGR